MKHNNLKTSFLAFTLAITMIFSSVSPSIALATDGTPTVPETESSLVDETQVNDVESENETEDSVIKNVLSADNQSSIDNGTADELLTITCSKETDFNENDFLSFDIMNNPQDLIDNLKSYLVEQDSAYDYNIDPLLPLNISVFNENNDEIKDLGKTTVKIEMDDINKLADTKLYHQKDNHSWEDLHYTTTAAADGNRGFVEFTTESFSPFIFANVEQIDIAKAMSGSDTPAVVPMAEDSVEDAYAILYDDGSMVFQRGDTPDSGKTVIGSWTGFEEKTYYQETSIPWYSVCNQIKTVNVKDVITPQSTQYWFCDCTELTSINLSLLDTSNVKLMVAMFADNSKLTSITFGENFNTSNVIAMNALFENCASLTELDLSKFNTSNVTSMYKLFSGCKALTNLDLSKFDTRNVTVMSQMFNDCNELTELNLDNFNTSKVTGMYDMFQDCKLLTELDLSKFDTGNVTTMSQMFNGCNKLSSITFGENFNTGKVTTMARMFQSCKALFSIDVSKFDTSNVTIMTSMFQNCSLLTELNVSNWNTGKTTDMDGMFSDCKSLTELNVSKWNTGNVTSIGSMFFYCIALTKVDVSKWDTGKVTNTGQMFYGCELLTKLDVSNWDTGNIKQAYLMFYNCKSLTELDVSKWNTSNVIRSYSMFYNCKSLTELDVSKWNMGNVTDSHSMFNDCVSLTELNVSNWNTSNFTKAYSMFYNCKSLTELDVSKWNIDNVTDTSGMFGWCELVTKLEVSKWNTSNVTSMNCMFQNCSSLISVDVSHFDTSKVTDLSRMFGWCESLKIIDVSGFCTDKAKSLEGLFTGCTSLLEVDVSRFNTSNVTDMSRMFYGCESLIVIDMSNFDTSKVTGMQYLFWTCPSLVKLKLGPNFNFCGTTSYFDKDSQKWYGITQDKDYIASDLWKTYNGATMADTYVVKQDIKFDAQGGKPTSYISGYLDMVLAKLPSEPLKMGSYFDGWYTEKSGGTKFNAGDKMTQMTYYAHWNDYKYNLVLKANGPDVSDIKKTLGYNDTYQLSNKLFEYDGYILTGWNTRKDGTGESFDKNDLVMQLSTEDNGEVIIYAQWAMMSDYAEISFDPQGGTAINSKTILKGSPCGLLETPQRKNYTFIDWHVDTLDGTVAKFNTIVNDNITLVAEWKKDPVVTFDSNGIIGTNQRIVKYNKPIGTLPTFKPNAHNYQSLIGWFTSSSGGSQITSSTVVTSDVTYYPHWGWQPKFNTNGGKFVGDEEYPVLEDNNYVITTLPKVSRDGYTLKNWTLANGVTEVHDGDTVNLSNGVEIIANWQRDDTAIVTFDGNGGYFKTTSILTKTIEYKIGSKMTGLYIPTKSNCKFVGWFDEDDNQYTADSVVDSAITLYAKWANKDFTVTFNAGSGNIYSSSKTQKVSNGDTLRTLPGARLTNYILDGWYTEENGQGTKLTTNTPITKNITYYAYYVPMLETSSDAEHLYTFGAEWGNASNASVDNVNNNLEFHPTDTTTQSASLHVRFELNQSIGETTIPAEAIQIRVPKYIWKNWDGDDTGTNNLSANLPQYPDVRAGMYFSYKEDGDDYVLLNNQEMAGGTGIDLTISYNVLPRDVPGGEIDDNGNYVDGCNFYQGNVPVVVTLDKDRNGVAELTTNKELSVEMHTKFDYSSSISFWDTLYSWNSAWGPKPADADDYFYIKWQLSSTRESMTQPGDIIWSDDTIHDGTLVCYNGGTDKLEHLNTTTQYFNDYVIMKYPVSLLSDIPETGLKLTNNMILNVNSKSGYSKQNRVSATKTLYDINPSSGTFSKNNGTVPVKEKLVAGGQEDILDDKKDVELSWNIIYSGSDRESPAIWDEEKQTYSANSRTIAITDGISGDMMYSSGDNDAPYVWDPSTGNIPLSDSDYSFTKLLLSINEYDARQEDGVWTGTYLHENNSDLGTADIYVRYKYTDDFVFYKTVAIDNSYFDLPSDVVGYQVMYDTSFYATTMTVKNVAKLHPTQHVKSLLQNDVNIKATSVIKNKAKCNIWNTDDAEKNIYYDVTDYRGGSNQANQECYVLNVSETSQYTRKDAAPVERVVFDSMKGVQDNPMFISGRNYNSSDRLKQIKTGEFYDLLPKGTTVDVSTLYGIPILTNLKENNIVANQALYYDTYKNSSSKLDSSYYDVRFVDNWQDSGRTMMIIKFTTPPNMKATGMQFWYMLHNTYENIIESGTSLENDVAFINTTDSAVLPTNKYNDQSTITDGSQYYDELQANNADVISYAKASTNYVVVDAFSWGYTMDVKTQTEYSKSDVTLLNNDYKYRLSYSQSDYATSSNIQFFDILESGATVKDDNGNNVFKNSEWNGIFKSVDVSSASEKLTKDSTTVHCSPTVYYSTKARDTFTDSDYDLSNTEIWTSVKPDDLSTITAVAVDCSKNEDNTPFVMDGKDVIDLYITMTAPTDSSYDGKTTYNESKVLSKKNTDESVTPDYSNASVQLKNVEPEFHKYSDPKSGTLESPRKVYQDDSLNYTLAITNNDDTFTLHDIDVSDMLPSGVNIDTDNMQVYFGDTIIPSDVEDPSAKYNNVAVTFDDQFRTESVSYDYVELYYQLNGITYKAGRWGGTSLAGQTVVLPTDNFYLYWRTDSSNCGYYGYKASVTYTNDAAVTGTVSALPSASIRDTSNPNDLQSLHGDYGNNVSELWHYGSAANSIASHGGVPITNSPRVKMTKSGNDVKFAISSLLPGETMNLFIPTVVTGDVDTTIKNTSYITSVNGIEKETGSETTYHEIKKYVPNTTITVDKTVTGTMGNRIKDFNFEVQLTGDNLPDSISYTKGEETGTIALTSGVGEFTLAHGENIVLNDIPIGCDYEIVETDGASSGYKVTATNAKGTISDAVNVSFVNNREMTVPTAAHTNAGLLLVITLLCAICGLGFFYFRKKNK